MDPDPRPEANPDELPSVPVRPEDLPVVARMVVEIRSDGVRTMARGALEDVSTGEKVAIETPAMTPFELSANLSASIGQVLLGGGGVAKAALRSLVPERVRKLKRRLLGQNDSAPD
jgi:hypothetical protein